MADPNEYLIRTAGLGHRFTDGTSAIEDIDFLLTRGEFVVLSGPNGSGKTVFVRHLNGLYLPKKGEVYVEGIPTRADVSAARQKVGLVFQDADSQIVGQTVRDDIAFGPKNLRLPKEEVERRVTEALSLLDLEELADHRPHLLSGGEKRRLAIAGVLALEPELLILDEPFSNLDYPGVVKVLRHITELHRRGRTILLVSHDIEKCIAHADRLVVFSEGRIVLDGRPSDTIYEVENYGIRLPRCRGQKAEESTWLS
jgi:biotin transport system ATP-binding protein